MLELAEVKLRFPQWTHYCDDTDDTLQKVTDRAGEQILEYVPDLTAETITGPLTHHFMNLVRKIGFDLKLGDREFENKPDIIKDYEYTLKRLELYREAVLTGPEDESTTAKHIKMSAKDSRFRDDWFN